MRRGLLCAAWFPRRSAAQQACGLAAIKPSQNALHCLRIISSCGQPLPSITQHGGEQGGPLPGAAEACNGAGVRDGRPIGTAAAPDRPFLSASHALACTWMVVPHRRPVPCTRPLLTTALPPTHQDTAGKPITCKAAIAWEAKKPLEVCEVTVDPPQVWLAASAAQPAALLH